MKRKKQQTSYCSVRTALLSLAAGVILFLLSQLAAQQLALRPGLGSFSSSTTHRSVMLMSGYPGFCSTIPPIDSSSTRWSISSLIQPSPPRAAARAAADAASAIHEAAKLSLASAEHIWKPKAATAAAQVIIPHAELNISHILQHASRYPKASNAFKGRGIVIVGGGKTYTPPAFACVAFLRRTGCNLPIEVWAPPHEPIPREVTNKFESMKAVVRQLGDILPRKMHHRLRKFVNKPAAILASSFREVLLLDSDNIPLRDPSYLFQHDLYTSSGLLMWPDFWNCEAQQSAWDALSIPPNMQPRGSHESGQIVIDKQRNWWSLLLALYLNMRGDVFYPMFSEIGQGDKETLPFSFLSLAARSNSSSSSHPAKPAFHTSSSYGLVPHPVLALGYWKANGGDHVGLSMLQRGPEGAALFLHVHMPKIDLQVSCDFEQRKWLNLTGNVSVLPEGVSDDDAASYKLLDAVAGFNVEEAVHVLRQQLRCDPAWVHCCL